MTKEEITEQYSVAKEVLHKKQQDAFDAPDVNEYMRLCAEAYVEFRPYQTAYNLIREPKMSEIPDYGDLMILPEFKECVECGGFTDYDGSGNYATETQMSDIGVDFNDLLTGMYPKWVTHIVWFNK